ncbi:MULTISPECIES: heavy metal translocating P-type ATPase [unclassified Beijerinckia]|uniref:heavy metal translocating P-type ATPase n=1 Tax=unclassified Beijerinckia TaxID=2638183 RepID=UPI00089D17BC|nr:MULTISPECIES: heavy metal translocating P-type ATPase [unclassified Beijerinckia]MDH7797280.1 Cd2+/Zn2+-exporting ATPase [Beijerinckia sp. GAS462]SEC79224.1 Cd2+/Zn2+-exporting ATPase [Beijerinckia sp. 28-YEA-48]
MAAASAFKLRIEGMDCGSCAAKIETAIQRLPGVSGLSVSYSQESLSLLLDEDRTSRAAIEAQIKALGFTPVGPAAMTAPANDFVQPDAKSAWPATRKGRLVLGTGVLLALAYIVSQIAPAWSFWAYMAATVVGLLPIARRALAAARAGSPFSIETLMSIAATGALAIGEAREAAIVVFLFAVGELLQGVAASRARAGVKALVDLMPRTARRLRGSQVETVSAEALAVGDIVVVRPGDRIPSDGTVVEGASEVSEAVVTGESAPVTKEVGSAVYAGSINAHGELHVEITRTAADNTIARIIHMVEDAQTSKAPMARFIDRFSRWYTPAAIVVSALVVLGPPLLLDGDWFTWIYRGLALLLIACPCALVISTPAAIASGLASGARHGLLIKGGAALETLGKIKTVAFDKTGTLTLGRPHVTDVMAIEGAETDLLAKAAAVEAGSSHPLGVAIVAEAQKRGLDIPKVFGGSVASPGKSVMGRLKSGFVSVSSPRYAAEHVAMSDEVRARIGALESEGKTVVTVSEGKRLMGLIALLDEPRADAAEGLERLRALGIRPVMLSGDNARAAGTIAAALGLEVRAELLPDAKLEAISIYKADAPVAMVGDGINDAPALAAASVGIAMGGGTDVALETADAALLKNRVTGVAELIVLSRATVTNIWQNVAVALGLKGIFLVSSLTGTTPLWMAILADTGATVLVTANALRLLRFKP